MTPEARPWQYGNSQDWSRVGFPEDRLGLGCSTVRGDAQAFPFGCRMCLEELDEMCVSGNQCLQHPTKRRPQEVGKQTQDRAC